MIAEDFGPNVARAVSEKIGTQLGAEPIQHSLGESGPSTSERLAQLPRWIGAHLEQDLSVEVLAGKIFLCPRHFSRLFRAAFQTTPAAFVEELRLAEAKRQLARPRAQVEGVAAAVGFRSADVFRRAFERATGMTPSAFRAQAKGKNAASAEPATARPRGRNYFHEKLNAVPKALSHLSG